MAYNNYSQRSGDRIRYDIIERIGVLGERNDGWTREVNIVAWNGAQAKVDIRDWAPDHKRMTKGVTLLEDEAENLVKALAGRYGFRIGNNTLPSAVYERRDAATRTRPAADPGVFATDESAAGASSGNFTEANRETACESETAYDGGDMADAFRNVEVAENAPGDEDE